MKIWEWHMGRARNVAEFFHKVHYAHGLYAQEMVKTGGSFPRVPGNTRWGSCVDCLQSVLDNRITIENTPGALRRAKYRCPLYDKLGWVWSVGTWDELQDLLKPATHLKAFIYSCEKDDCTLGVSLESYMKLQVDLEGLAVALPQRQGRELVKALTQVFLKSCAERPNLSQQLGSPPSLF